MDCNAENWSLYLKHSLVEFLYCDIM